MDLAFSRITKSYGDQKSLDKVSFEIKSGEFLFIVGPSGAGKTTLIKLILAVVKPSSGEITVTFPKGQKKKGKIEEIRRLIGTVYQDTRLVNDKTVAENIDLALDIINIPKQERPDIIQKVLKKTGLEDKANLFPSQLSGGELQRTSLARALAIKPLLLLADEPTGNLDPESSWKLVELLRKINKEDQTTIIMTTHNMEIVDSLKSRVIRLEKGKIIKDKKKGKYL
jgi:cell division transport system ATP-binding protein